MQNSAQVEPWLRGTLTDVPAVQRGVLHALELAQEDVRQWCADLTDDEVNGRPSGLPSVAFHLRHIAGSLDRLLTYAENRDLSLEQLAKLKSESAAEGSTNALLKELNEAIRVSKDRVRKFNLADFEQPRKVGRSQLPTTLGGLMVHVADHTQRHVGQAITTAKIIKAARGR